MGTVNDRFTLELVLVRPVLVILCSWLSHVRVAEFNYGRPFQGMYKYGDSRIYKESERGVW